jgi:hypothetical protein
MILRKREDNENKKRKKLFALCGESALEEDIELS